jgi:hypothetical protein
VFPSSSLWALYPPPVRPYLHRMCRVTWSIVMITLLQPRIASAQITINAADWPSSGQTFVLSQADISTSLDPEPTGADFLWDFSSLEPASQYEERWVAPTSTDFFYFPLFGSANMAQSLDLPLVPGFELTDAYLFFSKNSSRFAQTGLAGKFSGIPLPIAVSPEDRWAEFPMNFGDTLRSESAFELLVPGIAELREERLRRAQVDGWGTLITPFGSFEVLRQRAELAIRDSLSGSLGELVVERRSIEYRWLGLGSGLPLLQVDVQDIGGVEAISRIVWLDSLRSTEPPPSGLNDQAWQSLSISPNPAHDVIRISGHLSHPVRWEPVLYDASGREVMRWPEIVMGPGLIEQRLWIKDTLRGVYLLNTPLRRTVVSFR